MKRIAFLIALLFWHSAVFAAAPTVTTQAVTAILSATATGNGNVTADGGLTVTDRGIVWKLTTGPTTADNKVSIGAGTTGAFVAPIKGLPPQTKVFLKAYAINSGGTSYGGEVNFYPEPDQIFRCYAISVATALTAFPECHGLIGGKTYYLTDFVWSQSAASAAVGNFTAVQSGTKVATDCDTTTTTYYSGYSLAFFPAGPGRFVRPIKVTAGHDLCFIQNLAGPPTKNLLLLGFVGSTAQAAEIRTASATDFFCTMSSTAIVLTMITGCDVPATGKSYYINSFNWTSSIISTTTNFMTLSSGTTANCGANRTDLYAGFIQAAFAPGGPGAFQTPIKVPANYMLCFIHPGAGTRLFTVTGFVQ